MNNIILADVDGVLLNWEAAFDNWMAKLGHKRAAGSDGEYSIGSRYGIDRATSKNLTRIFNESATVGFLPPLRDAIHYVKKLHTDHGYVFRCITSLSLDMYAGNLRRMNLKNLFGETIFEHIECLDTGAHKDTALEKYRGSGCWWIEDKITNATTGLNMGLRPILLEHSHNTSYSGPIPRAKNWAEIYTLITGCTAV